MPATKDEWGRIVECKTQIEQLQREIDRINEEMKRHMNEEKQTEQFITTKKLTILMIISTLSSGVLVWFLMRCFP